MGRAGAAPSGGPLKHVRPAGPRLLVLIILACSLVRTGRADAPLHCLWELHGKHNTVYLLGSIHVLREGDYPLAPVVLEAYTHAKSLVMEVDLEAIDSQQVRSEMLGSATLTGEETLSHVLGPRRYPRAVSLAREAGIDLSAFEAYAPWFAAEAISEVQLSRLGFRPQTGVEMYFADRARADGKAIAGLETVHDQIALFEGLSMDAQADYLLSSLEQAHELPSEVNDMVRAWQRGDTAWFVREVTAEFSQDAALHESLLAARNRKWTPKIEALLTDDKDYLVIVGTAHLVGRDSVIEMLKKAGVGAIQR